jgi:hypothetical protein
MALSMLRFAYLVVVVDTRNKHVEMQLIIIKLQIRYELIMEDYYVD